MHLEVQEEGRFLRQNTGCLFLDRSLKIPFFNDIWHPFFQRLWRPAYVTYCTRAIITRGLYIFTPFFTAVYIVERLVLRTIYVLNKKILQ